MISKNKNIFIKIKNILNSPKKIAIFFVILAIVGFGGWKLLGKKQQKTQYQAAKAETGNIVSTVSASGQVLSVNVMSANTQASGIVKKVFVKDGDLVKKGDKILEIDFDFQGKQKNASAWSAYLSAKNSLASAQAGQYTLQSDMFSKWDSFKNLAENSSYENSDNSPNNANRTLPEFMISQDNWLATEAKYKNQQEVVAQTQAALNSSWLSYVQTSPTITAPTDGIITSLMYVEGMSIGTLDTGNTTSNQKVATIKTEGMPIVLVNLAEIDVSKIKLGAKATVILDSLPNKTFTGKVSGVDRIGSIVSGVTQYPSIIKLDTSAIEILPNMTATANIIIESKDNVLLVPTSAIQTSGDQTIVRVLKNNQEQQVAVEVGLSSDTQTEILSGLNEGDQVITGTVSTGSSSQTTSPFGFGGGGGVFRGGR